MLRMNKRLIVGFVGIQQQQQQKHNAHNHSSLAPFGRALVSFLEDARMFHNFSDSRARDERRANINGQKTQ